MDNSAPNVGASNDSRPIDYDNDYPSFESYRESLETTTNMTNTFPDFLNRSIFSKKDKKSNNNTNTIESDNNDVLTKKSHNTPIVSNSRGDNGCNIETKVIKFPVKNVPKTPEKFFSDLRLKIAELDSQIMITKLPCGSYNILVKSPREKVAEAVNLVEREIQPRISKKIRLDTRSFSMLTAKSFEITKEILQELSKNVYISSQSNNTLVITGISSDVNHALQLITTYMDRASASEVLTIDDIPQKFHPFIRGPFNCNIVRIVSECDNCISIDVPSPDSNSRTITISGPEEYRQKAKDEIMKIYSNISQSTVTKVFKIVPNLHANIKRACGIDKILKETNVAMSLPYEGKHSDSVIFVGESKDIANAFHLALARARVYKYCEIPCKSWILKILKQKPNYSFADLKTKYPSTWVSYLSSKECIALDGPSDEVSEIDTLYTSEINYIDTNMTYSSIKFPAPFLAYFKGDGMKFVNKICDATNVKIEISETVISTTPASVGAHEKSIDNRFNSITLFGTHDEIGEAIHYFKKLISQLEEIISVDINFDLLLYPFISAECQASTIYEEIKQKFGSNVKVTSKIIKNKRLHAITIYGKRGTALGVQSFLENIINRISTNIVIHDVDIPAAYHHLLVGKKGSIKDEIIESSGVDKIIFPNNSNNISVTSLSNDEYPLSPDTITIVGSAKACRLAEVLMKEKCNLDVELDQIDIQLPKPFIEKLKVGDGIVLRRIIASCLSNTIIIEDNYRSNIVNVHLPTGELQALNNVRIHGHKTYTKLVADKLISYSKDNCFCVESLYVEDGMVKSVIGKGGVQLRKFSGTSSVQIIVKNEKLKKYKVSTKSNQAIGDDDSSHDNVYLMGTNYSDVIKTKNQIVKFVKDLKDIIEKPVYVPRKYIKKFFVKKNDSESFLNQLTSQYPSVRIILPRDEDNSGDNDDIAKQVSLKGPSKMVNGVYEQILDMIKKWDATVRISFSLPYDHANLLRNIDTPNFISIGKEFDVVIRSFRDGDKATKPTSDTVISVVIEGVNKNVTAAKEKILSCGPITETFVAPRQYHRLLIGTKGSELKKIVEGYNISITFPENDSTSNDIIIRGPKHQIKPVIDRLKSSLDSIIKKQQEWEKNNFTVDISINPKWFSKLIGRGGKNINALKKQLNVSITIPKYDSNKINKLVGTENSGDNNEVNSTNSNPTHSNNMLSNGNSNNEIGEDSKIILRGEKKLCESAREKIKSMVNEWESEVTSEIQIPKSIHGKLRGTRSANVNKLQKKFKVDIRFSPINEEDNDTIKIIGQPSNVENAISCLKEMAKELIVEANNNEEDDESYRIQDSIDPWENFQFTPLKKPHQLPQKTSHTDSMSTTSLHNAATNKPPNSIQKNGNSIHNTNTDGRKSGEISNELQHQLHSFHITDSSSKLPLNNNTQLEHETVE